MADKFGKQNIPLNAFEENKLLVDSLRSGFLKYLRKEGPYAYCKLAKEIITRNDKSLESMYNIPGDEVKGIIESVFGLEYNFQDTIDSFLENCKRIPGYRLIEPEKKS